LIKNWFKFSTLILLITGSGYADVIVLRGDNDRINSQNFQKLISRGNELYKQGKFKKAIILYKKSAGRGGDREALAFNIGNCYYRLNDLARSAASYKKSLRLSGGGNLPALMNLAGVMFKLGEYGTSIALYRRLLKSDPEFISGWLYLADAYSRTGDMISAQLALEKAYRLDPGDVSILYQLAEVHVTMKEYFTAIQLTENAYIQNPDEIDFLFYIGDLYRTQNNFSEAAVAYRKGLSLKPDMVDILYKLADVLEKDEKGFLAMDYLQRALTVKPDFTDAAIFLGNLAFDLHMWDRSRTAYMQALANSNQEGIEGIRNIAFEYNKTGQLKQAVFILEEALNTVPHNTELKSDLLLYRSLGL